MTVAPTPDSTSPTSSLRPLQACSPHAAGCGYEMAPASPGFDGVMEAIARLGHAWPGDGRFVMLPMPPDLTMSAVRLLVDAASTQGLAGKLCLVGSMTELPDSRCMDLLARSGVMLVLDGVGRGTRFGDMISMPLNGIRFEADLVEQSIGDPALGSLVDAALHMARDLGLTTFARFASAHSRDACGDGWVDYASLT